MKESDLYKILEQALRNQIEWARTVNGIKDKQRLTDYESGFRAGFGQLRSHLVKARILVPDREAK